MDLLFDEDQDRLEKEITTCGKEVGKDYNANSRCIAKVFGLIDSKGAVVNNRMVELINNSKFSAAEKKHYLKIVSSLNTWEDGLKKYCTKST